MESQEKNLTWREKAAAKFAKVKGKIAVAALALTTAMMTSQSLIAKAAEEGEAEGIHINFQPNQMFQYSNVILDCMMPVVYITAGLSLGFTVIYALKSAFSSKF